MHRNLDRRVEVLVRLPSPATTGQVGRLLDLAFDERTSAWELDAKGEWTRTAVPGTDGVRDLQETLIALHRRRR
jgi:polyphosphate kinase